MIYCQLMVTLAHSTQEVIKELRIYLLKFTNYGRWHPFDSMPDYDLGAVSIRKTVLPGMAIPMLKIRRPNGRLIFNMEIAIRR